MYVSSNSVATNYTIAVRHSICINSTYSIVFMAFRVGVDVIRFSHDLAQHNDQFAKEESVKGIIDIACSYLWQGHIGGTGEMRPNPVLFGVYPFF